jgi:hypothetical protein
MLRKMIISTALLLAGCSGSGSSSGGDPLAKERTTPEDIGSGVYEVYDAFFKDVAKEIKAGAKDCGKIDPIAAKYKAKLVELGKKREALDADGKAKADSAAKAKANDLYVTQTEEYKAFDALTKEIKGKDEACDTRLFDYFSLNLYGNLENVKRSFPNEVDLYK